MKSEIFLQFSLVAFVTVFGCRTSMHGKVKLVIYKYYLLPVVTQQIG